MGRSLRPRGRLLRTLLAGLASAAAIVVVLELVLGGLRPGPERPHSGPVPGAAVGPGTTLPSGARGGPASGGTATAPTAPARPETPPAALKPVLGGLLDRHHVPPAQFRGIVTGFVVPVPWAALQPAPAAPLLANNPIDQAIAVARAQGLKLKLRVTAGIDAPEWAKRLGGAPVPVSDFYGRKGTVGRFWSERFGQAYLQLQRELAARYDNVPELVQTEITRCTTMFAEPFLRQGRTSESVRSLIQAGYTDTADEVCQRQQVDAHRVWQRTRSGLSFNPYQRISPAGEVVPDEVFTERMMVYCKQMLSSRCVLENHSIRSRGQNRWYDRMYQAMRALGVPIAFQTAAPTRIGNLMDTLNWAIEQGASSVELPVSYSTASSMAALDPIDQRLRSIAELAS
jgi:hypothetical protein